jgi:transcriptional regulator with XRE-family HTH domain
MEEWTCRELRSLGSKIREARLEAKLSQEQFAERADIHRTYVGQIELGKVNVSWENISRIARALRTKPSELFARAGL